MKARAIVRILFVIYCVEAGMLLLWLPWSPFWDRQLMALPVAQLQFALLRPWVRGLVSGFGLLHLVWGVHDGLDVLFMLRRQRGS